MLELYKKLTTQTFCSPKGSRKMISGWYSVYATPNGVVRLFRFDWTSGFAKIWWPDEFTISYWWPKRVVPGQVWMMESFWEQQLLLQVVSDIIPISKRLPNPMPDLINSYLDISYRIPIYVHIYKWKACEVSCATYIQVFSKIWASAAKQGHSNTMPIYSNAVDRGRGRGPLVVSK